MIFKGARARRLQFLAVRRILMTQDRHWPRSLAQHGTSDSAVRLPTAGMLRGWSVGKPQPKRENLAGLVERVTFHSEDSGFCVLRVKVRGQRDLITVIGHAATISAGEFIQV